MIFITSLSVRSDLIAVILFFYKPKWITISIEQKRWSSDDHILSPSSLPSLTHMHRLGLIASITLPFQQSRQWVDLIFVGSDCVNHLVLLRKWMPSCTTVISRIHHCHLGSHHHLSLDLIALFLFFFLTKKMNYVLFEQRNWAFDNWNSLSLSFSLPLHCLTFEEWVKHQLTSIINLLHHHLFSVYWSACLCIG